MIFQIWVCRALPCTRQEPFEKRFLDFQNLLKAIFDNTFLKVFGILKPFFQKGFEWGAGATPLHDKLQFINQSGHAIRIPIVYTHS